MSTSSSSTWVDTESAPACVTCLWHDGHTPLQGHEFNPKTSSVTKNIVQNIDPLTTDEESRLNGSATTVDEDIKLLWSQNLPPPSPTVVRAPARYVESLPTKQVRHIAADAFNVWLDVSDKDLSRIKGVIDLLHNASLILDDVEDGSISRRGSPATHMVFGTPQAINSAGFQINRALECVLELGDARSIIAFSEEMNKLYTGQGQDLFWTFSNQTPSVEEYLSMIDHKTGALFNLLLRLMLHKSPSHINSSTPSQNLGHLVILLGRYFQIRDDYMNLTSTEYTNQKGFCEDLDEGKFSITLIHAMKHAPDSDTVILKHILQQRHIAGGMSIAQKQLVLDTFKAAGSLDYTLSMLDSLILAITDKINEVESQFGIRNETLRLLFNRLKV